jgi:hypothetical protein
LSRASDGPLLQLPPAATIPDPDGAGLYSCAQQPVNFFALSVVTTFRERIVRDPSTSEVIIDVIDASIDLGDEKPNGPLLLVRDLAAAAQTRGRTVLSWTSAADGGWTLSGTLELTFTMPSMPIGAISTARTDPMLEAPITCTPRCSSTPISLWRTARLC